MMRQRMLINTTSGNIHRGAAAVRSLCVALALCSALAWLGAAANAAALAERTLDTTMSAQARGHRAGQLTTDASIRDLLSHPAFAGFGHLILPWDDRTHDGSMRLSNIGSLLPYHADVDGSEVEQHIA